MYNANDLHERLMKAFTTRYPQFRAMRFVFSGQPGTGKSTVLASVPVPEGKQRLVLDNEDSMAYLDAGEDGQDLYTPRNQQFKMKRVAFPTIDNYVNLYKLITRKPETIGAVCIDNGAILQEIIVSFLTTASQAEIRAVYKGLDSESILPFPGIMKKWLENNTSGNFWQVAKEPFKRIILACSKHNIHFLMSTEESNIWENYGQANAKIVGQKAKVWDVIYRYTDATISLKRDVNTTKPPIGEIYIAQPKNRLQGMNPRFNMDWEGFAQEIEKAIERRDAEIPQEAQVAVPAGVVED